MTGLNRLRETVRKIYQGNDQVVFGARSSSLPPEWESFFARSARGFRKQEPEPPEPEPEKEKKVEAKELLPKILEGIIERIEKIESRLEVLEAAKVVEEVIEEIEEQPVRKVDLGVSLDRAKMLGLNPGEFRDKRGKKWLGS